jgi:glutamate---cysteine ligase / carboxylate-amine ligase
VDHRFGKAPAFAVGLEDELLLVDAGERRLRHHASDLLRVVEAAAGRVKPDTYEAVVELTSEVSETAADAVATLSRLRAELRAAGASPMGAGIHPAGAFGDVVHVPSARYHAIAESTRGLLRRTPTCALHVHVSMPDPATAIRSYNRLRVHLPVLQGVAANSPFWHGVDSGLASARSALFRGFRSADVPRAFRDFDDYAETIGAILAAGELEDYTFLWWDIRPHPRLGSVEVRAMDAQSSLATVAGLTALIQGLAAAAAEAPVGPLPPREAIAESSFRAGRDGIAARIAAADGTLRPLREVATDAIALARPHARAVGSADALEELEGVLREGGGADRQRAAHARGGMPALLEGLVRETALPWPS